MTTIINEKILDHSGMTLKADGLISASGDDLLAAAVAEVDEADEIEVAATAANYTAASADVEAHLAGIDAALGARSLTTVTSAAVAAAAGAAKSVAIPLNEFHPIAALKDALPDAGDGTSLGLADAGLFMVGSATSGDAKTETATAIVALDPLYKAAGAVVVTVRAKVSAEQFAAQTIDLEVKECSDGALGADICATAVQNLTTSFADYAFTITATNLVAGDILHVKLTAVANDTGGTPTAGHVEIASVKLSQVISS